MTYWLQDFAYKVDIAWWMFVLAGLLAIGIALITVSFQSIKPPGQTQSGRFVPNNALLRYCDTELLSFALADA